MLQMVAETDVGFHVKCPLFLILIKIELYQQILASLHYRIEWKSNQWF
jgi:hypothetical protein